VKNLLAGILLTACCATASADEPLPLWEAGASVSVLDYPDYRGATHRNVFGLPLPYVIYRGDKFRITREGAKAKLLELNRLHVDLSGAASLPGKNSDDSPRKGMPDLLPTFEVGPSLDWWLTDRVPGDWNWRLRLPVRAVAGFNFTHSRRVGWLTHPNVQVDHTTKLGEWDFDTSASVGATWATRSYHQYFYQVDPQYVTPTRPAYEASAGYSGASVTLYGSVSKGRWRFGAGFSEDWLDGVAFRDSPLVQTRSALVVGAFVIYRVWASDRTVGEDVPP
jgi:outer membrane protein